MSQCPRRRRRSLCCSLLPFTLLFVPPLFLPSFLHSSFIPTFTFNLFTFSSFPLLLLRFFPRHLLLFLPHLFIFFCFTSISSSSPSTPPLSLLLLFFSPFPTFFLLLFIYSHLPSLSSFLLHLQPSCSPFFSSSHHLPFHLLLMRFPSSSPLLSYFPLSCSSTVLFPPPLLFFHLLHIFNSPPPSSTSAAPPAPTFLASSLRTLSRSC